MRLFLVILISSFLLHHSANARPMITDISERKIDIHAKFTGKELLLYGARIEAGEIVVVIRGPEGNYVVRKKDNIAGMWVNTSAVEFEHVPQFYLMAASDDISNLDAEILKDRLGIGYDTLKFEADTDSAKADINRFSNSASK